MVYSVRLRSYTLLTVHIRLLWRLRLSTMDLIDNGMTRCGTRPKSTALRGKEGFVWFGRYCERDTRRSTSLAYWTDIASANMLQ